MESVIPHLYRDHETFISDEDLEVLDELMDTLKICDSSTDARIKVWQTSLKPGDYFITTDEIEENIIYGKVLPFFDEPKGVGINPFRKVRVYWKDKPKGEEALFHIVFTTGKITEKQFEKARQLGWPDSQLEFVEIVKGDPQWDMIYHTE